jgi:hypothetical protein
MWYHVYMNNKKRPAESPAEDTSKSVSTAMTEDERMELIRTVAGLRRLRMKESPPLRIPERR